MVLVCYVRELSQWHGVQNALDQPKDFFADWNVPIFFLEIKQQHLHAVPELNSLLEVFGKERQNNFTSNKTENGERHK